LLRSKPPELQVGFLFRIAELVEFEGLKRFGGFRVKAGGGDYVAMEV
jgi:hypothetical protein